MDSALKEVLREERRRNDGKRHKEHDSRRSRNHEKERKERKDKKHHSRRSRSEPRRSTKHSSRSDSITTIKVHDSKEIQKDDGTERFMFVYEDSEGQIHTNMDSLPKVEDSTSKIFPVYVAGYNDNLSEEEIVYKDGQWSSSVENSWLDVINSQNNDNIEILTYEGEDIVVYNGKLFHCLRDLRAYLKGYGAEYLPIKN